MILALFVANCQLCVTNIVSFGPLAVKTLIAWINPNNDLAKSRSHLQTMDINQVIYYIGQRLPAVLRFLSLGSWHLPSERSVLFFGFSFDIDECNSLDFMGHKNCCKPCNKPNNFQSATIVVYPIKKSSRCTWTIKVETNTMCTGNSQNIFDSYFFCGKFRLWLSKTYQRLCKTI